MSKGTSKYEQQRPKLEPPRAGVGAIRNAKGMTLDQVCDRMSEQLGRTYSRGALSAIENGIRGASQEVLAALEVALDLRAGDLVTAYTPTTNTRRKAPAA